MQESITATISDVEDRATDWVVHYGGRAVTIAKAEMPWEPMVGRSITVVTVDNEDTSITIAGVTVR